MISTRNLSELLGIEDIRTVCKAIATLDAIICPEWEYRYYSYNSHWGAGEEMASMRNGSGDEYFILFTLAGAILKGFAHESTMSPFAKDPPQVWPGILDSVPPDFSSFLVEPAFSINETTFCIWRKYTDESWVHGPIIFPNEDDPDGSAELLRILDGSPITYQRWAEEYYESSFPIAAIQHIYTNKPLSQADIEQLNSALLINDLQHDVHEIGYPFAG